MLYVIAFTIPLIIVAVLIYITKRKNNNTTTLQSTQPYQIKQQSKTMDTDEQENAFTKCSACHSDNTIIIQKTVQLPKSTSLLRVIVFIFIFLIVAALFFALTVGNDNTINVILGYIGLSVFFLILAGNFAGIVVFAFLYHYLRPYKTETYFYLLCKDCGHIEQIII